jgi:precorrin-2 dehydrogenase/sirohydrochlorin ferrochelatase
MIPIVLDPARIELALVGRGDRLVHRLRWLEVAGARQGAVYTDQPVAVAASLRLVRHLPEAADLAAYDVVWITGLAPELAAPLARATRRLGPLVHVDDVRALCDVHTPAVVRRGDLLIGITTGRRSPGLAAQLRRWLDARLGGDRSERLEHLARARAAWRRRPRARAELAQPTDPAIDPRS